MPPHCLPAVLANVKQRRTDNYTYGSECTQQPDPLQLARLVQLPPRSFHPAILRACCASPDDIASFSIPLMPPCSRTCAAHCLQEQKASPDDEDDEDDRVPWHVRTRKSPCAPECASATFQLLAAAAPLAGGNLERAWDVDGAAELHGPATPPSQSLWYLRTSSSDDESVSAAPELAAADVRSKDDTPPAKRARVRQDAVTTGGARGSCEQQGGVATGDADGACERHGFMAKGGAEQACQRQGCVSTGDSGHALEQQGCVATGDHRGSCEQQRRVATGDAKDACDLQSPASTGDREYSAEEPAPACMTGLSLVISVRRGCGGRPCLEPEFAPEPEPPRWCAALAQLRSLRSLSICAHDASRLCAREFGAALRRLPALQSLHVECLTCAVDQAAHVPHKSMERVLTAVCELTQLSALTLINCFFLGQMDSIDELYWHQPLFEERELSKLTGLTSLTLRSVAQGGDDDEGGYEGLVHAVKQMAGLRELHVHMRRIRAFGEYTDSDDAWMRRGMDAEMVLQLCTATELTALQSLRLPGTDLGPPSELRLDLLHNHIARDNAALLARLTALDLSDVCRSKETLEDFVPGVLDLLADTTALRSLRLRENRLRDAGVSALADAVPRLPNLQTLAIGDNGATHVGICAVLSAIVTAQAAGAAGVRDLDICGRLRGGQEAAEKLGGLLRQCHSLEVLHMMGMRMSFTGTRMRAMVEALEALPCLRRVRVLGSVKLNRSQEAAVQAVFAGLTEKRVRIE